MSPCTDSMVNTNCEQIAHVLDTSNEPRAPQSELYVCLKYMYVYMIYIRYM